MNCQQCNRSLGKYTLDVQYCNRCIVLLHIYKNPGRKSTVLLNKLQSNLSIHKVTFYGSLRSLMKDKLIDYKAGHIYLTVKAAESVDPRLGEYTMQIQETERVCFECLSGISKVEIEENQCERCTYDSQIHPGCMSNHIQQHNQFKKPGLYQIPWYILDNESYQPEHRKADDQLITSIHQTEGNVIPINVVIDGPKLVVEAGHRRVDAIRQLWLSGHDHIKVLAVVNDYANENVSWAQSAVSNLLRKDLTLFGKMQAFHELKLNGMKQKEIAKLTGTSEAEVSIYCNIAHKFQSNKDALEELCAFSTRTDFEKVTKYPVMVISKLLKFKANYNMNEGEFRVTLELYDDYRAILKIDDVFEFRILDHIERHLDKGVHVMAGISSAREAFRNYLFTKIRKDMDPDYFEQLTKDIDWNEYQFVGCIEQYYERVRTDRTVFEGRHYTWMQLEEKKGLEVWAPFKTDLINLQQKLLKVDDKEELKDIAGVVGDFLTTTLEHINSAEEPEKRKEKVSDPKVSEKEIQEEEESDFSEPEETNSQIVEDEQESGVPELLCPECDSTAVGRKGLVCLSCLEEIYSWNSEEEDETSPGPSGPEDDVTYEGPASEFEEHLEENGDKIKETTSGHEGPEDGIIYRIEKVHNLDRLQQIQANDMYIHTLKFNEETGFVELHAWVGDYDVYWYYDHLGRKDTDLFKKSRSAELSAYYAAGLHVESGIADKWKEDITALDKSMWLLRNQELAEKALEDFEETIKVKWGELVNIDQSTILRQHEGTLYLYECHDTRYDKGRVSWSYSFDRQMKLIQQWDIC